MCDWLFKIKKIFRATCRNYYPHSKGRFMRPVALSSQSLSWDGCNKALRICETEYIRSYFRARDLRYRGQTMTNLISKLHTRINDGGKVVCWYKLFFSDGKQEKRGPKQSFSSRKFSNLLTIIDFSLLLYLFVYIHPTTHHPSYPFQRTNTSQTSCKHRVIYWCNISFTAQKVKHEITSSTTIQL